jgi:hypothetical protein
MENYKLIHFAGEFMPIKETKIENGKINQIGLYEENGKIKVHDFQTSNHFPGGFKTIELAQEISIKKWGKSLETINDIDNNKDYPVKIADFQKKQTTKMQETPTLNEKYSIKTDGKTFVPVKVETLEGREYHAAIYEKMGFPQSFAMANAKDIDFAQGYKDVGSAQKAGFERWEKNITLERVNQGKTKEKHVICERDGKFIPVEMVVGKGRQINSILGPGIRPDHISEKANTSVPGKLSLDFAKGFNSLKDAKIAVEKKWGKEIKPEIVKIQTKIKTNEQKTPGKAVQRLRNQRMANPGQTHVR